MKFAHVVWLAAAFGLAVGLCQRPAHAADTIEVFAGHSTRIIDNSKGTAWGVARVLQYDWGKLDFGYINEGTMHATADLPMKAKRDGIMAMARMERRFVPHFNTYAEIGPYMTGTTISDSTHSFIEYRPTLLGGLGFAFEAGPATFGGRWLHVIGTPHVGSADVFTVTAGVVAW